MVGVAESGNAKGVAYIVRQSQQVVVEWGSRCCGCAIPVRTPYQESEEQETKTHLDCGAGVLGYKNGKGPRSEIKPIDHVIR